MAVGEDGANIKHVLHIRFETADVGSVLVAIDNDTLHRINVGVLHFLDIKGRLTTVGDLAAESQSR